MHTYAAASALASDQASSSSLIRCTCVATCFSSSSVRWTNLREREGTVSSSCTEHPLPYEKNALVLTARGETAALSRLPHREKLVAGALGSLFKVLQLALFPLAFASERFRCFVLQGDQTSGQRAVPGCPRSSLGTGTKDGIAGNAGRTSLILTFLSSSDKKELSCASCAGQS